jgi:hypothetical protein
VAVYRNRGHGCLLKYEVIPVNQSNKELKRRCDAEGQRGDYAEEEVEVMAQEMAGAQEVSCMVDSRGV